MNSRLVRVALLLAALGAVAAGGFVIVDAEQALRGRRAAAATFDGEADAVLADLGRLKSAQQGYVAEGQGTDYWMSQATEGLARADQDSGGAGAGRPRGCHALHDPGRLGRAREVPVARPARAAVREGQPGAHGIGRHLHRQPGRAELGGRSRERRTKQRAGGRRGHDGRPALAAVLRRLRGRGRHAAGRAPAGADPGAGGGSADRHARPHRDARAPHGPTRRPSPDGAPGPRPD